MGGVAVFRPSGGAPADAPFVVVGAVPASLPQGRQLAGTANRITVVDGGAGGAVTLTAGSLIVQTDQANTWTTGVQTINTGAAGTIGLIVKGNAGQTANLTEWHTSASAVMSYIGADGAIAVNQTGVAPTYVALTPGSVWDFNAAFFEGYYLGSARFSMSWREDADDNNWERGFLWRNRVAGRAFNVGADGNTNFLSGTSANSPVKVRIGNSTTGGLNVFGIAATTVQLVIKGAAAQTANLLELQESDGSIFVASGDGLAGSEFVINEQGENIDFRVESATYDALFVDADNDSIDIMHHASGKIGMYAVTPVVQAAHIADPAGGATVDAEARTAINAILVAIENIGITASV